MLVNATEMLIKARDGHYGVPQFNINNLEWTKSVLTACEEMKSPVILGVSEGAGKYMTGFKTVAAMVSAMVDSMGITVPVALHLDHGTYEGCKACIDAGSQEVNAQSGDLCALFGVSDLAGTHDAVLDAADGTDLGLDAPAL